MRAVAQALLSWAAPGAALREILRSAGLDTFVPVHMSVGVAVFRRRFCPP
jgi:hypothetical protein